MRAGDDDAGWQKSLITSADGDNDDSDDDVNVAVDDDCDKQYIFLLLEEVEVEELLQAEGVVTVASSSVSDGVVVRVRTIGLNNLLLIDDGD